MTGLTKRIIRQMTGDRRSVAMILLGPVLVLSLLYLLLGSSEYRPAIAVREAELPPKLVEALRAQDADLLELPAGVSDIMQYLRDNRKTDAVLSLSSSGAVITLYEPSTKSAAALKAVQNAFAAVNPSLQMETRFVVGREDASSFDNLGYVFFGLFSFFFIFLLSGMSLVKERSSGTLERLLMTPISRREVILGYTAGYGFFAIAQAVIMVLYGIYVLGLDCLGNVGWVILSMLLLAVTAVSFGALVSVFSNSELQVVQFIPLVFIPQVFFSGLIPLDTIPYGLGKLGYLTPVFYGCTALKQVMVVGGGFSDIWPYLLGLLAYGSVLSLLNTLTLKKYRRL